METQEIKKPNINMGKLRTLTEMTRGLRKAEEDLSSAMRLLSDVQSGNRTPRLGYDDGGLSRLTFESEADKKRLLLFLERETKAREAYIKEKLVELESALKGGVY